MTSNYDFKSFKNDTLTKPRDIAWSEPWAKFEKVGDMVQGYVRDVFFRAEEKDAAGNITNQAQRGITLEQENGKLINVGIKRLPFILNKTNNLRLGDPLSIVFESTIPNADKKKKPTKVLGFYGKNLETNLANKTVAELDNEDEKLQVNAPANDPDFDGLVKEESEVKPF